MLLIGCTTGAVVSPPPAPVDWHAFDVRRSVDGAAGAPTPKERAIAERYAGALSSDGFAGLGAMLDPAAHFVFPGAADAQGRDAVVRAHEALFGAFDSRVVALTRVWRTDSTQVLEWTFRGKGDRPFGGAPATHAAVDFPGLTILWTKDEGLISDLHVYFDVASLEGQLRPGSGGAPSAVDAGPLASAGLAVPTPGVLPEARVFEQIGSGQEQRNVASVRSVLDALEQNREADYLAAMSDDVELTRTARAKPLRGKADLLAHFRAMHAAIRMLDTTVENAWGVGDFAIVEYALAGEQRGPVDGIPARRDAVIRLHVVDVVRLEGGKVASIWRYDNPKELTSTP